MMAMMEHPEGTTYHDAATDTDIFFAGGAAAYDRSNAQHVAFATAYDLLANAEDPLYVFNVIRR